MTSLLQHWQLHLDTIRRKECEHTQNQKLTESTVGSEKRTHFAVVAATSTRLSSDFTAPPPVDRRRCKSQATQYTWVNMGYGQAVDDLSGIGSKRSWVNNFMPNFRINPAVDENAPNLSRLRELKEGVVKDPPTGFALNILGPVSAPLIQTLSSMCSQRDFRLNILIRPSKHKKTPRLMCQGRDYFSDVP